MSRSEFWGFAHCYVFAPQHEAGGGRSWVNLIRNRISCVLYRRPRSPFGPVWRAGAARR